MAAEVQRAETVPPGRRPARSLVPPVAAVLGGTLLIALHALVYSYWLVDDAAITFSYARNVADGLGPVFQPGAEPVEGYSNPAWLALLVIGKWLGLFDHGAIFGIPDYVLFPKGVALLCCVGILVAFYSAARVVSRHPAWVTFGAGALLAAVPSFVIWSFSGLENSLYGLAVAALACGLVRAVARDQTLAWKVAVTAGLLAALAALTRPDGLIYCAVYPLVVLLHFDRGAVLARVRAVGLSLAAFAVPVGAYFLWRKAEFGIWLANTAVSKRQGFPELAFFGRAGLLLAYAGALAVLTLALCVGIALTRSAVLRNAIVTLLVPLALAIVAYALLEPDWMGEYRFATPVWVLAAFVAAVSVGAVLEHAGVRGRIATVGTLVLVMIPAGDGFVAAAQKFRDNPSVPMCGVATRYGRAFNGYADVLGIREGTFVAPDMGGAGMTSRLALVDMVGLVDRRLGALWGQWDMPGIRDYIFDEVKPTFIHSHTVWSDHTGLLADPRMMRDYEVVYTTNYGPETLGRAGLDGDFVRKDAVQSPEKLQAVREYAVRKMRPAEHMSGLSPLGKCGETLSPGQLPWPATPN
ncbi:hypothetical protein [Actinokineospora iranica]|nr:hypothetical protein [Actinokineospora iranica]